MWESVPHHLPSGKNKWKPQWDTTSYQGEWWKLTRQETTNVAEDVEKEEPSCIVGGNVNWYSLSGKLEVPQRVKNRSSLWPSNCTAGDLPQRFRCSEMLEHLHLDVSSSNIHNSQSLEELKDEWIKKMWFMFTVEYYWAIRNDKYPPFTSTWMELECIMLSEVSQSDKDKHYIFHSFGEYK